MAEFLLKNTDNVIVGGLRRTSQAILSNLKNIIDNPRFKLVTVDLCDPEAVRSLIRDERPDYFINFGAQTFVKDSWKNPVAHMMTNAVSVIHILEAIREYNKRCRFYSAGSSEQWGDVKYTPQDENHPMSPRSPYGVSKCAASHIVKVWRESYGLYAVHGILLNHESERRQEYFVTRKITKAVARIKHEIGKGNYDFTPLELGNINSFRDWSHAEDFVEGVWRMLNQVEFEMKTQRAKGILIEYYSDPVPKEYVLSSGETHSIREFVEKAFAHAGIPGVWRNLTGNDLDEEFVLANKEHPTLSTKRKVTLMKINPEFYRPADVDLLHGDSSAARNDLGWEPKISFQQLVERMVEHDLLNFSI